MSDEVLDEDLDSLLTADSVVETDSVSFNPDKPHWSVSRDEMIKLLRIVSLFPAKATIFLAIWKEGQFLRLHSHNKDAVLDSQIPISNEDAYDTDKVYFLNSKLLLTFIQNYSSFVFSFDENKNIYFESPYSVYQLENYSLSLDDMYIDLHKEEVVWSSYPLTKFQTNVFKQLFSIAASLNDSKMLVLKDEVKANYTLYQHSVVARTDVPEELIIRRIDLPAISEISDGDVELGVSAERLFFKFSLGTLSFLKLKYNPDDFCFPETYALGETTGEFQADIKLLRRALKLTNVLSSPIVDFKSEGDQVFLFATDKAKFTVGTGSLKDTFSLSTELFTKIVDTINPSEVFVNIKVTEKGVDITIENDKVIKYSMSKTTVGQQKRKEKIEKKLANREVRKDALKESGKFSENLAEKANSIEDVLGDDL